MSLTLVKPAKSEFEYKTHEYSPTFYSSSSARFSPKFSGRAVSSLPASASYTMAEHRGLPPPSAMTLPNPNRGQSSMSTPLGTMPPAPSQWQGSEEGMKNWLMCKSEEEKRLQEEQKTKQEGLKLDQRRIEQEILRDSMHGGIPPHLIPLIFASIGGANVANMTAELVQEHSLQLQASQQRQYQAQAQQHGLPQSQPSPESQRRIGPPPLGERYGPGYGPAPQTPQAVLPSAPTVLPGQHMQGQQQHATFTPPGRGGPPTSAPRAFHGGPPPGQESHLPRLNTTEVHPNPVPTASSLSHQVQQSQPAQQNQDSSPIYFHHWVPPTAQAEKTSRDTQPATPSGKYKVSSERPNASDPEYTSSPKKRKLGTQGSEGPVGPTPPTWVPPTTIYSYTSPSYSTSSTSTPRRGHGRNRSDASGRGTDAPRGARSRGATLRGHEIYAEGGPSGETIHEQQQPYPQQPPQQQHGAESHYQQNPYAQQPPEQQQQAHAQPPMQRNDGRGDGPQARAPSPRALQAETRQSGPHQLAGTDLRSVPSSPKRDVRGHQD